METRPEFVIVGRFGRIRGVVGEIYLTPLTDNPGRFRDGMSLWVEEKSGRKELRVASVKEMAGRLALKLEGVDSPEEASHLTNGYAYVEGNSVEELEPGRYYRFDLVGCRVCDMAGKELGRVVDIEEYPASDLLTVETADGRRHLVPMVKAILKSVDIAAKVIEIDPPAGLFDLTGDQTPDKTG